MASSSSHVRARSDEHDDESDFEIASQAEEEDKAETALTDVDLADEVHNQTQVLTSAGLDRAEFYEDLSKQEGMA